MNKRAKCPKCQGETHKKTDAKTEEIITDQYLSIEKGVKRIVDEYNKYGEIIIAYDFDSTVNNFYEEDNYTYEKVISLLKAWKGKAKFMCFTVSNKSRFPSIRKYARLKGIPLDVINDDIIQIADVKSRKPFWNILLDDRAGLPSAYIILREALSRIQEQET